MSKSDEEADRQSFRDAMRDVKPLAKRTERITPLRPPSATRRRKISPPEPEADPLVMALSDYEKYPLVSSDDLLFYAREGIPQKTLRNLRRGPYNPGAVLDLHGKTTDEARLALGTFMLRCQKQKIQYVRIIHGKGTGTPILKNRLNHWLREIPFVLAFCSANRGALSVLLRRTAL